MSEENEDVWLGLINPDLSLNLSRLTLIDGTPFQYDPYFGDIYLDDNMYTLRMRQIEGNGDEKHIDDGYTDSSFLYLCQYKCGMEFGNYDNSTSIAHLSQQTTIWNSIIRRQIKKPIPL